MKFGWVFPVEIGLATLINISLFCVKNSFRLLYVVVSAGSLLKKKIKLEKLVISVTV